MEEGRVGLFSAGAWTTGEGKRIVAQPPCPPQAVEWSHLTARVEVERLRALGLLYLLLPCEKLSAGFSAPEPGIGSLSAHGGAGRQTTWIYHVHNRVNKCSATMKAQRERLRIPGLTLEWVFSLLSHVFSGCDDRRLFICSVSVAVAVTAHLSWAVQHYHSSSVCSMCWRVNIGLLACVDPASVPLRLLCMCFW